MASRMRCWSSPASWAPTTASCSAHCAPARIACAALPSSHPRRPLPNCVRLPRPASAASGSTSWACHTGCELVVDHFGRPGGSTAGDAGFDWLLRAAAKGRTWVKLSAAYRNWPDPAGADARRAARSLLDAAGPHRLLWGSDWPHTEHREHTSYTHTLAVLDEWIPDPEARRCILAETPAALFRFSKETS